MPILTVVFVAEDQESHSVCSGRVRGLGRRPSVSDTDGMFLVGHQRQSLYTVGELQQRRCGEGGGIFDIFRCVSSAADADDLLV